jgi:hypothetical protein
MADLVEQIENEYLETDREPRISHKKRLDKKKEKSKSHSSE